MHSTVDLLGHEDNDSNAPQDLRRHSEVHGCQALDQEQHMQFYIQNSTVKLLVSVNQQPKKGQYIICLGVCSAGQLST